MGLENETHGEFYALIGVMLGALAVFGMTKACDHVMSQPAPAEDISAFQKMVGISLTPEQTTESFAAKDPVTHQLQQKALDGKRWGLVAELPFGN
ncbi:MAG: hypothetical protein M1383_05655 [Patescibacteria group bacterium]|nr:hypothetical protein [Patescibacteria group bacterium]